MARLNFKDSYKQIFGEEYKQENYKHQAHSFNKKAAGKPYCSRCGLVALRNKFTQWSITKGCLSELHPDYPRKRKQL